MVDSEPDVFDAEAEYTCPRRDSFEGAAPIPSMAAKGERA